MWSLRSAREILKLFGIQGAIARARLSFRANREYAARIPERTEKVILRFSTTDVAVYDQVFVQNGFGFDLPFNPTVIVDAGANCGISPVYFALRFPNAKIIALEPEPSNFAVLQKNARAFPRIIPIQAALWHKTCNLELKDGGNGLWSTRVIESSTGPVRGITMSDILRDFQIDRVGLLKVDVEGAEHEIFSDAQPWIEHVDAICIELHDCFREGCSDVFNAATPMFPKRWRRGEVDCVTL